MEVERRILKDNLNTLKLKETLKLKCECNFDHRSVKDIWKLTCKWQFVNLDLEDIRNSIWHGTFYIEMEKEFSDTNVYDI